MLGRDDGWSWLETDPVLIPRAGIPAAGLLWLAGAPSRTNKIDRNAVLIGHDPQTLQETVRVDLGLGIIGSVHAVADEVWLTVARRRFLPVPNDKGGDVIAVAASGAVRTIHAADSLDVSFTAPPLVALAAEQVREHVGGVRSRFGQLDAFWRTPDGTLHPLASGLTQPTVAVVGDWPDTRLVITLTHSSRPGLRLRRTLALFDERGRPEEHEYADIHLMEDLDTGYLAPATEAVDGVLDT